MLTTITDKIKKKLTLKKILTILLISFNLLIETLFSNPYKEYEKPNKEIIDSSIRSTLRVHVTLKNNNQGYFPKFFNDTFNNHNFSGSGFILKKGARYSYIVTNAHVVGRSLEASYEVIFYDGTKAKAYLFYSDPEQDIAVLLILTDSLPKGSKEVRVCYSPPREGEEVFMFLQDGLDYFYKTPTYGQVILALRNFGTDSDSLDIYPVLEKKSNNRTCYEIYIEPGSSGMPVFNNKGELLLINSSILTKSKIASGIESLKVRYILDSIKNEERPIKRGIGALVYPTVFEDSSVLFTNCLYVSSTVASDQYWENKLFVYDFIVGVYLKNGDLIRLGNRNFLLRDFIQYSKEDTISLCVAREGELIQVEVDIFNSKCVDEIIIFDDLKFFNTTLEISKQFNIPIKCAILNVDKGNNISEFFIVKRIGIEENNKTVFFDVKQLKDIIPIFNNSKNQENFIFELCALDSSDSPISNKKIIKPANSKKKLFLVRYNRENLTFERFPFR